jgi:hypothetical protein
MSIDSILPEHDLLDRQSRGKWFCQMNNISNFAGMTQKIYNNFPVDLGQQVALLEICNNFQLFCKIYPSWLDFE